MLLWVSSSSKDTADLFHQARRKKPGMHLTEVERLLQQIDRELGRLWETLAINNYHQLP